MRALVTGGARCGKSTLAESLAIALGGDLVYLATMRPHGAEGARRVERHRAQRVGKGFATLECYEGLESALATGALDGATVLLEDLGNLVANVLFETQDPSAASSLASADLPGRHPERSAAQSWDVREASRPGPDSQPSRAYSMAEAVSELATRAAHLVVVGNEVGSDGFPYGAETRAYQEEYGRLACETAALSDLVIECVAGLPVAIKAPVDCGVPDGLEVLFAPGAGGSRPC